MQQQQSHKQKRRDRLAAIRKTVSGNLALQTRASKLQEKMEKKTRKCSTTELELDELSSSRLLQDYSDDETQKSLFNDKYELREKAGQGAHGVVKKCIDRYTGETCAVKTIKLEREHFLYIKHSFMDVKALKHPNIVSYKALFFEAKTHKCHLVTEYFPIPDLEHARIRSEEELKIIIFQLLKTLKYLHSQKICHRDIKPDNILYDQQSRIVKLIDFGISKKVEQRGRKRQMLTLTGTPYYRAPEMFEGGGYDERVDLWALGVTIYKLMTGLTPFESEYHMETINNIIKGEFNFPAKLKFQCSQSPKSLVKRLLKKNKKERLSAIQALKDVWFLDLNLSNQYDDEWSHSMSENKLLQEFAQLSPLRYNLSHSPVTQVSKKVDTTQCTKSFKEIFEQRSTDIFGMEESQMIDLP